MKTRLSWTIWALSLTTLSLTALSAGAVTNYTTFSTLPASQVISNADGMAFYWKNNGVFVARRIAWSNLFSQLTIHSTNSDLASAVSQTNFDIQFARVGSTGTVLNAVNAIGTNQSGIWLVRTNGIQSFFSNNLTAAYTVETPDDLLVFGNGRYNGGISVSKPVRWTGVAPGVWNWQKWRHEGGVIITNTINVLEGCSNSLFENFAVEANDATFMVGIQSSNLANNVYRRLSVGDTSGSGSHNMYITGNGNLVEGCQVFNSGNHGLLVMGSANTIVKDCISLGNRSSSYVIKSDPNQLGSVSNVVIQNCIGDAGILIQAATNSGLVSHLSRVTLHDITMDTSRGLSTALGTIWCEAQAGCSITDLTLDNVSFKDYRSNGNFHVVGFYAHGGTPGGTFTNVLVQRCSIQNSKRKDCYLAVFGSQLPDNTQIRYTQNTVNGISQNGIGFSEVLTLYAVQPTNTLQIIGMPDLISNIFATNGHLYAYYNGTNFSIPTNLLSPGDPIWVTNGLAAGVYAYETTGMQVGDEPIFNRNGYNFFQMSFSGTNGMYTPTSLCLHGKTFAQMTSLSVFYTALVDVNVVAESTFNNAEGGSESLNLMGNTSNKATIQREIINAPKAVNLVIVPHAWATTNGVFFGAFGNPVGTAWAGQGHRATLMELTARMPKGGAILIQTNGWQ